MRIDYHASGDLALGRRPLLHTRASPEETAMRRRHAFAVLVLASLGLGCGSEEQPGETKPAPAQQAPAARAAPAPPGALGAAPTAAADLPRGLLLALSAFGENAQGKPVPRSELVILVREGGAWKSESLADPESNVFHKAMVFDLPGRGPGILTLGGTAAIVKHWRKGAAGLEAKSLWQEDFGGKFSRMRDAEAADLYGDGRVALAVVTHDQGVVAMLRPAGDGSVAVAKLDAEKDTFVHEVEVGDLDGDGVLEVYATPSEPNKLDGKPQPGKVVRYVPAKGEGRQVVADLGDRHAKEILVGDVDGDGRDELYVSIEAVAGGKVEIRRYDAGTDPGAGALIASLDDSMCRFLTVGDFDGDGRRELLVAAKDTGVWLLRPGADPRGAWRVEAVDRNSKGFEHAALAADLDGDGTDELYVASDDDRELRRYVWVDGKPTRETIYTRPDPSPIFTWNLMPVPVELVR
jgi:hypothetical protein